MSKYKPIFYQRVEKCVDEVIKRVGKNIVLGMPLGLGEGKPCGKRAVQTRQGRPGYESYSFFRNSVFSRKPYALRKVILLKESSVFRLI